MNSGDDYVKTLILEQDKAKSGDYLDCWKLFKAIDIKNDGDIDGLFNSVQLFIAYNEVTDDIVVSFRGSDDVFDFILALNSFVPGPSVLDSSVSRLESLLDDELVPFAVSAPFNLAYLAVRTNLRTLWVT